MFVKRETPLILLFFVCALKQRTRILNGLILQSQISGNKKLTFSLFGIQKLKTGLNSIRKQYKHLLPPVLTNRVVFDQKKKKDLEHNNPMATTEASTRKSLNKGI